MKRFSVALTVEAFEAVERVAKANHWSRERAARRLIWEALAARSEVESRRPAQVNHQDLMIHHDRGESDGSH